jgi:protein phosphatase
MRFWTEQDPFAKKRISAAFRTDPGQERPDNEDRAAFGHAQNGGFYAVVCDGMGGEVGGEIAASIAVETIARVLGDAPAIDDAMLVGSIQQAAADVRAVALADRRLARMGTTATLATITGDALTCAQVGDSRAYLFRRDGSLERLTSDQTLAEHLVRSGLVPRENVRDVVGPNVILQALGASTRLDVVVSRAPVAEGDVVLVCSDGLHGVVGDDEIATILSSNADPRTACEALVARANELGGPDNVTCVVAVVGTRT